MYWYFSSRYVCFKDYRFSIYLMGSVSAKSYSKLCHHYEDTYFNALLNKEENTSILTYENIKLQI